MPGRNVLKVDVPDSYYHVYARGHSRSKIFLDEADYDKFLSFFKRYLGKRQQLNPLGVPYPHLYHELELLSFCLMENHFHLLVYQRDEGAMTTLMRGIMSSYSRYFNKKYDRSGALFESRYKASLITSPSYLEHISRYIHLNRKDWLHTPYSSIGYYLTERETDWIKPGRVMQMFASPDDYRNFVADYAANQRALDELKYQLANTIQ